ncbi:MAG: TRAP transporter substrate-binding protein DctP [Clostridia bacterium]|nr:TRAP transporter substrate-binding protein DctP [Clostridia bacterium]
MKRFFAILLACLMVFSLVACAGGEKKADDSAKKVLNLKYNSVKSSTDSTYLDWADFYSGLEKATDGAIKVEMYASEALGPSADILEQAAKGEPVIADTDLAYLANYVPDFAIGNAPYVFKTPEDIEKFWQSDYCKEMEKILEEQYGLHIINITYFGTRNLIANTECHSRADVGKLKIRCAATPMWNEVCRVLGGNAVNTAWSETYSACSQGVADGAESPVSLLYSSKLYEPCPYIMRTEHLVAVTCEVMSAKVYNDMDPELRAKFDEYARGWCDEAIKRVNAAEKDFEAKLVAEGVTFVDIDKTEFIEAAKDTPKNFPDWTPGMYDKIVEFLAN